MMVTTVANGFHQFMAIDIAALPKKCQSARLIQLS